MLPEQIAELANAGESETLEFKKSTAEMVTAMRAVCAMLNHRGGRVLFGVTQNPTKVVGQEIGATTLERVAQSLREIDPPAFPIVDRVPTAAGREVIVITVGAGQSGPYSYQQRAYRRVGNTNEAMTQTAYKALLLETLHATQRWENQPVRDWATTDLDAASVRRTVAEAIRRGRLDDPGTRDLDGLLRGLGLLRDGQLLLDLNLLKTLDLVYSSGRGRGSRWRRVD